MHQIYVILNVKEEILLNKKYNVIMALKEDQEIMVVLDNEEFIRFNAQLKSHDIPFLIFYGYDIFSGEREKNFKSYINKKDIRYVRVMEWGEEENEK